MEQDIEGLEAMGLSLLLTLMLLSALRDLLLLLLILVLDQRLDIPVLDKLQLLPLRVLLLASLLPMLLPVKTYGSIATHGSRSGTSGYAAFATGSTA